MARVFVSHASTDAALAGEVHGWLVADGHEVFLARDLRDGIAVGEDWQPRLHERLRWADAVVCLLTRAYIGSTWCSAEIGVAQSRGSRLLPIGVEPGVTHPLLTAIQHVDLTGDGVATRARLAETLRRLDMAGGAGWPDDRSPFPGLRAFDTDLCRVFFGRAGEVEQLGALLRSPAERAEAALLLVVGPSGCGKSSLVRAGLLPVMAAEPGWATLPTFLPGMQPVGALAREVAGLARRCGLGWSVAEIRGRLEEGGFAELADELLLSSPGGRSRRLLVVVDQFEELLTQTGSAERARFAHLLSPALAGPVQVVATLRPEFLDQLLADRDLAALPTRVHTLRPLRREALRSVIEGPANLAAIAVEEDLVARLITDTDSGEALPLLAYTLAQLADGIGRGGQLSARRYEQLGGVQGALARQAEAALADATTTGGRGRDQVVKELLRLVAVDEQGRPTRLRVRRDELPEAVAAQFDAFVARRLLTIDRDNGNVVVGVAHEAFLSVWSPLAAAIAAASTALRARGRIEQAAADWAEHGQPLERLWERGQLAAALADTGARLRTPSESRVVAQPHEPSSASEQPSAMSWWNRRWRVRRQRAVVSDRVELSGQARTFLRASIRRDRRRRGRSTAILSILLVLALIAAGVAFTQRQVALDRGSRLNTQLAAANAELLGRDALTRASDDPVFATKMALAAWRSDPTNPTAHAALAQQYATMRSVDSVFSGFTGKPIDGLQASRDGQTLLLTAADDVVVITDFYTSHPSHWQVLDGPPDASYRLSPNGRWLVAISVGGAAVSWDVPVHGSAVPLITGGHATPKNLPSAAFSPDGNHLAVLTPAPNGGTSQDLTVWDMVTRTQTETLRPIAQSGVIGVALGPDPNAVLLLQQGFDERGLTTHQVVIISLADGGVIRVYPRGAVIVRNGAAIARCQTTANHDNDDIVLQDAVTGVETARYPASSDGCFDQLNLSTDQLHVLEYSEIGNADQARMIDLRNGAVLDFTLPLAIPTGSASQDADLMNKFQVAQTLVVVDAPNGQEEVLIARKSAVLRIGHPTGDFLQLAGNEGQHGFFDSSRRYIVVEQRDNNPDRETVAVHDSRSGQELGRLVFDLSGVDSVGVECQIHFGVFDSFRMLYRKGGIWRDASYSLPQLALVRDRQLLGVSAADVFSGGDVSDDGDQTIYLIAGELEVLDDRTGAIVQDPIQVGQTAVEQSWFLMHAARIVKRPGHADQVAIVTPSHRIAIWSITEHRQVDTVPLDTGTDPKDASISFDETGDRLSMLAGGTIRTWTLAGHADVHPAILAPEAASVLGFSSDGYLITSARTISDSPATFQFWDIVHGTNAGTVYLGSSLSPIASTGAGLDYLSLDGFDRMPDVFPMNAQQWSERLCQSVGTDFTANERQTLPVGSSPTQHC